MHVKGTEETRVLVYAAYDGHKVAEQQLLRNGKVYSKDLGLLRV